VYEMPLAAAACPAEAGLTGPAKAEEYSSMHDRDITLQDSTYRKQK
jgi:hypothetical protein